MLVLVTYDVSFEDEGGQRRLRHISKICQDYGIRVQYSVFECDVTPAQWEALKAALFKAYNSEVDSLRFYNLGSKGRSKVEHYGAKPSFDVFNSNLIL